METNLASRRITENNRPKRVSCRKNPKIVMKKCRCAGFRDLTADVSSKKNRRVSESYLSTTESFKAVAAYSQCSFPRVTTWWSGELARNVPVHVNLAQQLTGVCWCFPLQEPTRDPGQVRVPEFLMCPSTVSCLHAEALCLCSPVA